MSARTPASASRSAASQAIRVARAPSPSSSARRSSAPGASGPRRLSSTRCSAPAVASRRARWAPRPPVPPVTRTVPRGSQPVSGAVSGAGTRRRPKTAEARTATWSSPSWPARTAANRRAVRSSSSAGRSTRPPQAAGCSSAATRPMPHTAAWTGAVSASEAATATAPRVTHHRGAATPASRRAWNRTAVATAGAPGPSCSAAASDESARASRDTTPVRTEPSAESPRSRPARVSRPAVSSGSRVRRTTSVPTASSTAEVHGSSASAEGTTASQVPEGTGALAGNDSGFHASWCRWESTLAWSRRLRRQVDRAGSTAPSASVSTSRSEARPVRSSPSTAVQKAWSSGSALPTPSLGRRVSGQ